MVEFVRDSASEMTSRAKDGVLAARERVVRKTVQAKSALAARATRAVTARKDRTADRLASVANVARQTAHVLRAARMETAGEYVEKTAAAVEGVTKYIEGGDAERIVDDSVGVLRRNPVVVANEGLGRAARFAKAEAIEATDLAKRSYEEVADLTKQAVSGATDLTKKSVNGAADIAKRSATGAADIVKRSANGAASAATRSASAAADGAMRSAGGATGLAVKSYEGATTSVRRGAAAVSGGVRKGVEGGRDVAAKTWDRHPLLVSLGLLAAGVGVLLPAMAVERKLLGAKSEKVMGRAKTAGTGLLKRGKRLATKAVREGSAAAAEEAEIVGLTPERVVRQVKRIAERVGKTMSGVDSQE